ncbi:MAG: hypothetical protein JSU65_05465 [Candidatus Zixiibacteriota bacterium]|nr:MAG: hypothetical protein JSU65_05465 [candidate division Zixibacteria bacterium]
MKKRIVFVSIFDLTRVYYKIARSLQQSGHDVYWITTSEVWTNWLLERGVKQDDILQLIYDRSDFVSDEERKDLADQIAACERNTDITVNQVLMMDRFVLYKNKPDINEYVYLYYRDIKAFLLDKRVEVVFAEPTNINELLTYMVCRELGIDFLNACLMRFPPNRMIFCSGFNQSQVVPRAVGKQVSSQQGRALLKEFARSGSAPFYFVKLNRERVLPPRKVAASVVNRLKLLVLSSRKNLTHHDLAERLMTAIRRIVNGFYLRHISRYSRLDEIDGRLAFYPLHVQPEASIDVRGSYFSDQLKLIKDIRRALPFDVTLVIKEHPNFLGLRGRQFFRAVRRIPSVSIVRHDVSTFDVYKRADLVFTVSGTCAYEAGMLGVPAITFAPMYFGGFSSVQLCESVIELKGIIENILNVWQRDYEADCRFMAELLSSSHEGYWTNPLFDPLVMEADNLAALSSAFARVIDSTRVPVDSERGV